MANPHLMTGLGAALSIFLAGLGSSVASIPAGLFLARSTAGIKAFFPIVISGVLAIYGLIVAVLLCGQLKNDDLTEMGGYTNFSAGLSVGLACLASGIGMCKFMKVFMFSDKMLDTVCCRGGGAGASTGAGRIEQLQPLISHATTAGNVPEPTYKFLMVMVFLEAIGLYGLIVALFLADA